ncbi:MAG TPA: type IX secretion system protein PorQ, partial [Phaeodactylibacter sp.]|nr:type IX secretion system protein PorQ [Phaeodactylibacter sp.]
KANEYALSVAAAKQLYPKMAVGGSLKFITSQLEDYNSVGLAADLGFYYQDTASLFAAALVIKNMGMQLSRYHDVREDIPFDVQIGISQKLAHLPFRISISYHDLHRWNIRYDDPNTEEDLFLLADTTARAEGKFKAYVDNFFRHLTFGGEFLLGKKENLQIRFGYNHQRRKELTVENLRSLTGFSLGIGMKIKRFRISYGHAFYHLAGGTNHISITTNLGSFRRRIEKTGA